MKVIIYNGQNKFTVDNISIPNNIRLAELLKSRAKEYTIPVSELQEYNFKITSTRGAVADAESNDEDIIMNEELEREVEEGIFWKMESVN
jgi:hypothetical protein